VFAPGADGKPVPPRDLLAFLAKLAPVLKKYHPHAEIWVSPQSFKREWMDEFLALLKREPEWLTGVVFGPSTCIDLPELRQLVPARYGLRFYPDITHSATGQYPVADWDEAYALTHGRESINPRPVDEAAVFRLLQPHAERGFITYSEGCNDDVNKMLWSRLGWDPAATPEEILREYSRYFIGADYTDGFAQGLQALEQNWRGPLLTNRGVDATLAQFQALEKSAPPPVLNNWRFQLALYRAYYDAYVRARLQRETGAESDAMAALRGAGRTGSLAAMTQAEAILTAPRQHPPAPELRARIFELGGQLFKNIGLQLSVPLYRASDTRRGASLDTIDTPLNNAAWLLHRFTELGKLADEPARRAGLGEIVNWTNPGPGGFYDNLGDATAQPHLVRGPGEATDPGFVRSANADFVYSPRSPFWRYSWRKNAETLFDTPLEAHYTGLDPSAHYRVRVVYSGEDNHPIRLTANDRYEIHSFRHVEAEVKPLEFDIPAAATHEGNLTLQWHLPPGVAKGAQCAVAEVWVIKQ
jgi:hypothetical protein